MSCFKKQDFRRYILENRRSLLSIVNKIILYLLLGIFVFIFAFPFYFVFVLASQEGTHMYSNPPHIVFNHFFFTNISTLMQEIPFGLNFFNSAAIAVLLTIGTLFFCTLGGFSLSKYRFKGRKGIILLMMSTLAIPQFLNIIPFFKMMVAFNWYNTWLPLVIPGMANAFGIFLMSQFLQKSIPNELMDAARIDGLTEFKMFVKIVVPLSKSGMSILGIVTFIGSWNNFLGALIMVPDRLKTTLPVALSRLFISATGDKGALMAGTSLSLIPIIIIFLLFSKQIIAGLTAGSVKG